MRRFYLIGFLVLMLFDTLSQVCFKLTAIHAAPLAPELGWLLRVFGQPWVYGAILGYLGAFFTWMTLLEHAPIGPAFAASHLEVITVMLASVWLFGEHVTLAQYVGAMLIVGGILCLAASETNSAHIDSDQS
jgi:drug/metabolite transporter (DMT)-like permease